MEKIYNDAKDKNVCATYVYGKSTGGDTTAYVDEACTVKFKTSELKEVFLKGAIIVIGGTMYYPISFAIVSNAGVVTYAKKGVEAGSAATATLSAETDG